MARCCYSKLYSHVGQARHHCGFWARATTGSESEPSQSWIGCAVGWIALWPQPIHAVDIVGWIALGHILTCTLTRRSWRGWQWWGARRDGCEAREAADLDRSKSGCVELAIACCRLWASRIITRSVHARRSTPWERLIGLSQRFAYTLAIINSEL